MNKVWKNLLHYFMMSRMQGKKISNLLSDDLIFSICQIF